MLVGEELGFYAELMKHGGVQVPLHEPPFLRRCSSIHR